MKNRIVIALAIVSTALLWFSVALQAQMMPPKPLLTVEVPFAFVAGGMNLPAGQYIVFHTMSPDWIMLKNSDAHAIAVLSVRVSPAPLGEARPKLVFNRYGEKYFLSQVWTEQDNEVHNCSQSSAERVLARSSQKLPEVATVYAKH
ncbi:MAG TPA: hypothetical protein VFJ47_05180 [Terriglobales bacterium]|nr:hypothetical protein [Terriglobales bacterium]